MRRRFIVVIPIVIAAMWQPAGLSAEPSNPAHALAEKFANADKPPSKPAPVKPSADEEKEILDAARAEADARRRAEAAANAVKSAEAPTAPTASPPPAPAPSSAPPAAAKPQGPPPQQMQIRIEAKVSTPGPAAAPARDVSAPRATLLVVLTDHAGRTALTGSLDPVICFAEQCYVSTGSGSEAGLFARADALSSRNTITNGAGACKGKAKCAYRGVTLKPSTELQIVDLGIVKHDRREAFEAKIDTSCKVDGDELVCSHPLTAPDYRIWVVPESVAEAAGAAKLDAALDEELPEENVALDGDK